MQHKKLSSFFQIHNKQSGHAAMPTGVKRRTGGFKKSTDERPSISGGG
jgi:hypothetical protein